MVFPNYLQKRLFLQMRCTARMGGKSESNYKGHYTLLYGNIQKNSTEAQR